VSRAMGHDLRVETALLTGSSAQSILAYAREKYIDLIVMGHARPHRDQPRDPGQRGRDGGAAGAVPDPDGAGSGGQADRQLGARVTAGAVAAVSDVRSHERGSGLRSLSQSHPGRSARKENVMLVGDLMTTAANLITVPPQTPILEARRLMLDKRIRHLLVTDADRLLGIVTDRDIRLNLPSRATSLSVWEINHLLLKLTVDEVMTRGVITVGPDRDARDAAQLMLDHSIGALPVTDGGALMGIVTETDVLRAFVWMSGGRNSAQPVARARR
jgi:CBS domain-containing protein